MLRSRHLFLLPGDSPAGYRLPLESLVAEPAEVVRQVWTVDPMSARGPLARPVHRSPSLDRTHPAAGARPEQSFVAGGAEYAGSRQVQSAQTLSSTDPVVRTAVSVRLNRNASADCATPAFARLAM